MSRIVRNAETREKSSELPSQRVMEDRIGFMQGRLSPVVGGRVQAFPWDHWRDEFPLARLHGFRLMEWTLDQEGLYRNPFMTETGQDEIRNRCRDYAVSIPSLTGDCFMQVPFWHAVGVERLARLRDLGAVIEACGRLGVQSVVVPLVDEGRVSNRQQEDDIVAGFQEMTKRLVDARVRILVESDYPPSELQRFIERCDPALFGINYDIGNSAALGFDPSDEISAYGHRIGGIHIKDRLRGGTTVPLGTGDADFESVFEALARVGFIGDVILQTARADDGHHTAALCRYRDMTVAWLACHPVSDHAA
jgi:hexulose-6-phosphate isomerase